MLSELEPKWADRKRGGLAGPTGVQQLRTRREAEAAAVLSGRSGASPKPALQLGPLGVAMPIRKQKPHRHVKRGVARAEAGAIPELASDASQDDSPTLPSFSPTPRASEFPVVQKVKRFAALADLKVPNAPGQGGGIQRSTSISDGSTTEASAPSIAKLNNDYNSVLRRAKEQRKLPHERDVSPRRARVNSAESSARRQTGRAQTPDRNPSTIEERYADDGALIAQPQSAALFPTTEEDDLFADPDTDAALDGGVAVTARRIGRIRVAVRKRPFRDGETGEECLTVEPPNIHIGAIKQRVDLSEYKENHDYQFDDAFDEGQSNDAVYHSCGRALIDTVFEGGSASCFAYGQTGSGKTHTMIGNEREPGMYMMAAADIFERVQGEHHVFVSLYEIYCNSLFDLLNYRTVVVAREDASKKVNICGLTWHEISSVEDLHDIIERGTVQRRTGSTSGNEFSSRSHAVLTITLRDETRPKFCGSLNIVDLAGSERAADTAANDKQTRLEGAEINKSLLALKECIRGLDERKRHIPFRGSKLTEVLRDSFVGNSRTVMVATISPSSENVEHTLNTLRYAFRVKGLTIAQVEPSKERNAPRPAPVPVRSKSVDPQPAVVSLPPIRERRKKKSRERKRATYDGETPRTELMDVMERGLKTEIQTLREEITRIAEEKDEKVNLLVAQNNRLEKELRQMRKMFMNARQMELNDVEEQSIEDL